MMHHRLIDLGSIPDKDIRSLLPAGEVVALVGSAISTWEPSNLPTGGQLKDALYNALFPDECGRFAAPNPRLLRRLYDLLPFEVVNERCPEESTIRDILVRLLGVSIPNPVHIALASMMEQGLVQSILTPNYDCCLDAALAPLFIKDDHCPTNGIRRVVPKVDPLSDQRDVPRVYLKLHGSTDDPSGRSLVFRLQQEGMLDLGTRRLFRKVVKGRTLLVIGYSGSDFDICPEIPLAEPRRVVWNLPEWDENSISPNTRSVAEKAETTFVIGDMLDLIRKVHGPIQAERGHFDRDLAGLVRRAFLPSVRRLWKVRVLNSLTYNLYALNEIEALVCQANSSPELLVQALSELAGASASHGEYRRAATAHDLAARHAQDGALPAAEVQRQLLFASDAWRCYGDFPRALVRHWQVARSIPKMRVPSRSLVAAILRNEILLSLHAYEFLNTIRFGLLARKIQGRAARLTRVATALFRRVGEWHALQQIRLWSERFNLPPETTMYLGEYETPASQEGYSQLNFPMGRMMSFRSGVKRGLIPFTEETTELAVRLASEAADLGITPEIWKLHLLLFRRRREAGHANAHFHAFWQAFRSCEYSVPYRLWQLLVGD